MTLLSSAKMPPDILCLYGARALRGFGDGFAIIILPVYLSAIGFSPQQIGIVASASLLGTAALTLITGFIAPRFELQKSFSRRRRIDRFHGPGISGDGNHRACSAGRFHRKHQSFRRRSRHAGSAGACAADQGDRRPGPHRRFLRGTA